jgi:hypothetical protein
MLLYPSIFSNFWSPIHSYIEWADGIENVEIIYVWTLNRVVEELPSPCPQDI